jgi:antitoxin VapB
MKTAKVFKSGNSQAVRIPKEFQLKGDEVEIRRRGNMLILRPKSHSWTSLVDSLTKFTNDFLADGRRQPTGSEARPYVLMVLLLDTDVCIYLIRQRPASVLQRFDEYTSATSAYRWSRLRNSNTV